MEIILTCDTSVTSVPNMTPTQRLAGLLLGEPVNQWISLRRSNGASWRAIAKELDAATGGQVDVTYETLRGWMERDAA